jgi:DNA-directed RNA polymerase subunit L
LAVIAGHLIVIAGILAIDGAVQSTHMVRFHFRDDVCPANKRRRTCGRAVALLCTGLQRSVCGCRTYSGRRYYRGFFFLYAHRMTSTLESKLEWLVRTETHALVRLNGEDFTVAKFLQGELLAIAAVSFASCDVQDESVVLCVRMRDGTMTAQAATVCALKSMRAKCDSLNRLCAQEVRGYADTPGFCP